MSIFLTIFLDQQLKLKAFIHILSLNMDEPMTKVSKIDIILSERLIIDEPNLYEKNLYCRNPLSDS